MISKSLTRPAAEIHRNMVQLEGRNRVVCRLVMLVEVKGWETYISLSSSLHHWYQFFFLGSSLLLLSRIGCPIEARERLHQAGETARGRQRQRPLGGGCVQGSALVKQQQQRLHGRRVEQQLEHPVRDVHALVFFAFLLPSVQPAVAGASDYLLRGHFHGHEVDHGHARVRVSESG